jgi:DNA-binding HxlR family transcriptional regulator
MENNSGKFEIEQHCPIRNVLDRFGDKWSILVIQVLSFKGRLRFSEIGQQIGDMSQKMLTVTLRSLEADGLVIREFYPEIPPRVEYELTDLGRSLVPHIQSLTDWSKQHLKAVLNNRKKFEEKQQKKTAY